MKSSPRQNWNNEELPPYPLQRQAEKIEVYELALPPKKSTKFFVNVGKICVATGFVAGLFFVGNYLVRRPAALGSADRGEQAVAPASSAEGPESAPVVKAIQTKLPEVGYVSAWGIGTTGATITWSTDVPATTMLLYGTSPSLDQHTAEEKTLTASHGVTLSNLKSGTTYYFVARSADRNATIGDSAQMSFTTKSVGIPPTISDVVVEPSANREVTISWKTSKPANSYFTVGKVTPSELWSSHSELTTEPHCVAKWVPRGTIKYQLVSVDADGNKTVSREFTFVEP